MFFLRDELARQRPPDLPESEKCDFGFAARGVGERADLVELILGVQSEESFRHILFRDRGRDVQLRRALRDRVNVHALGRQRRKCACRNSRPPAHAHRIG